MENPIVPFRMEESGISAYGAFDALAQTNPEIASLAYAHKEGLINGELLPYVARFRELKSVDRANVLNYMADVIRTNAGVEMNYDDNRTTRDVVRMQEDGETERTGLQTRAAVDMTKIRCDADVEITRDNNRTLLGVTKLQEDGATERNYCSETEETKRRDLECRAAVDMTRLKYEADVRIINDQMRTERYLSDNQIRAKYIETQALEKAMRIQAMVETVKSKDQKMAIIKKAEFEYLAKIREAELLRATEDQKRYAEVSQTYLVVQANMYQLYLEHEFGLEVIRGQTERQAHKSDEEMVKSALRAITSGNLEEILIEIKSTYGPKTIRVKANGKK